MKSSKKICAIMLSLLLVLSLAGCGATEESSQNKFEQLGINVQETPAQLLDDSLEEYEDPSGNFTALVPEGWKVSIAGFDMYHWIRLYDPEEENLQVFALLKADNLLGDYSSKEFYESMRGYDLYKTFADMIVAENVEDFYSRFMDYCDFTAKYEPTYAGFDYPQIIDFFPMESLPYDSYIADVCFDNRTIHGAFKGADDEFGEGMFTGSMCHGVELGQARTNTLYNITAITAPNGLLLEYEDVLAKILGSIVYTDQFLSTVAKDQQIQAAGIQSIANTMAETSEIVTSGWYERDTIYDKISEEESDAILGYERVYDIETGEVYRAYNGFSDVPGMDEYFKPITDDMYSDPIVGYIEK